MTHLMSTSFAIAITFWVRFALGVLMRADSSSTAMVVFAFRNLRRNSSAGVVISASGTFVRCDVHPRCWSARAKARGSVVL